MIKKTHLPTFLSSSPTHNDALVPLVHVLPSLRSIDYLMTRTMMMMMGTQHIPTRWESDIMVDGGNMTQSNSHHTHI